MFKKTRLRIHNTIEALKAAFELFVSTVEHNTASLEALRKEQTELRTKFDVLVEHTHFLARAKKNEIQRAGHRVD